MNSNSLCQSTMLHSTKGQTFYCALNKYHKHSGTVVGCDGTTLYVFVVVFLSNEADAIDQKVKLKMLINY